jgi:hypothetical protein
MARLHRPDVIVLDLDGGGSGFEMAERFASLADEDGSELLILGNLPVVGGIADSEIMGKPYHYKPLILRIEELLGQRCGRAAA